MTSRISSAAAITPGALFEISNQKQWQKKTKRTTVTGMPL